MEQGHDPQGLDLRGDVEPPSPLGYAAYQRGPVGAEVDLSLDAGDVHRLPHRADRLRLFDGTQGQRHADLEPVGVARFRQQALGLVWVVGMHQLVQPQLVEARLVACPE